LSNELSGIEDFRRVILFCFDSDRILLCGIFEILVLKESFRSSLESLPNISGRDSGKKTL